MPCFLSGLVGGDYTCFRIEGGIGTGNNIIYVDPEHDVVAVRRWINGGAADGFVRRRLAAIE
jgi:hypothetical protein